MKQYKTKRFISVSGSCALICLLASMLCPAKTIGQYSSLQQLGATVYDDQLVPYDFDSVVRSSRAVICVIGTSCTGCIEYFADKHLVTTFIYFIDDLSIMEMNRERFQKKAPGAIFYFTLRTTEAEKIFSTRSPQLILYDGNNVSLLDYAALDRLTKGFTLARKKAMKQLNIH